MAEGIVIEGKSLVELEREITCGICQEHYTEPKALPCLHYYCKQCVLRLALRSDNGKSFSCPDCRCEATLPEGGVDELKTAFFVNRLKSTVSKLERVHGKIEAKCELCSDSEDKAEAFCRQCAMFICKECVNSHKRMKLFITHEVAFLEDLKLGRAKPIAMQKPPIEKCLDHEEALVIYCFDCHKLICHHCTVKDHKEHNIEFCKKAAPSAKTKLLESLEPLKQLNMALSSAVENIRTTKEEVEYQGDSVAGTIQSSFKELYEILVNCEQKLLEEAKLIVQEKLKKLSVQEKNLSLASAEVQSVVDYTEQCARHCTDNEVMSMHAEIRRRIEREIEEHRKSGKILEPVEEVDMGVEISCAVALQQLCRTQANIIQLPIDSTVSTITMEKVIEVSKASRATVTTRLCNSEITKMSCTIDSQLKYLSNGTICNCKINQSGTGEYSIEYTPAFRGCHELHVIINGQHLPGSPYPVSATISPTQLGKPLKMWVDISEPTGITVNSMGEILVTEFSGKILKLGADGRKEVLVRQSKLNTLRSITVDDRDNIYCANKTSNEILTCNKNGGNIRLHKVDQLRGPGHHWVKVVGSEVMVSECYSIGIIMVYDTDLVYLRRFEHGDMGEIGNIAADQRGYLYATDYTNSCIQVFSGDGHFLNSFDCDRNGMKKLDRPRGVWVSGQYLYVCNYGSHNVSVFTTDGVHVTSFGRHGSKKGEFMKPYHLCVDQACLLYVADFGNNRVQCF